MRNKERSRVHSDTGLANRPEPELSMTLDPPGAILPFTNGTASNKERPMEIKKTADGIEIPPPSPTDVLYEKLDGFARITLNRPTVLNALNRNSHRLLGRALDSAEADDDVRAVILTGVRRDPDPQRRGAARAHHAFSGRDEVRERDPLSWGAH